MKRKLLPYENKNLDWIRDHFLRTYDQQGLRVYKLNVEMYEKDGVDTGEHRRWVHYYKNKLEGKL
jgi:hypothetical protein